MATPATNRGPVFHYFWVKIMGKESYNAARKKALDSGKETLAFAKPMRPGIVPMDVQQVMTAGGSPMSISVGYLLKPESAERHGLMVDVREFKTGYSDKQVTAWLEGDGAEWAKDGLCVLFRVAVETGGQM